MYAKLTQEQINLLLSILNSDIAIPAKFMEVALGAKQALAKATTKKSNKKE